MDGLTRQRIARKIKELRSARGWTQHELAKKLDTSQSRLSELERGDGSFSAEQFLEILRLFNVTAQEFVPSNRRPDAELQQALARFGGSHLFEPDDVLPSERLDAVHAVIRETIVTPSPRHITALAPVLVHNAARVNLNRLELDLQALGLAHRLAWVVDNTRVALGSTVDALLRPRQHKLAIQAIVILDTFLQRHETESANLFDDIVDPTIRTKKTLDAVKRTLSVQSRRWGIISELQPSDFEHALRESHVLGS